MTLQIFSFRIVVLTLSALIFLNRCQDPDSPYSRDFRSVIFFPEVHDQQIIYSIDSLIFIGKPFDAISLSGQSDDIPAGEHQTYLKSRLLEAFTQAGKENRELYQEVMGQTAKSAQVQFVRDFSIENYNSRFNPGACDFQKIKLLLENAPRPYLRAQVMHLKAYWFKEIKFDLDSSWHWYQTALALLNTFPFRTMAHADCFENLSTLSTYKRKNLLAIWYANEMADTSSYYFTPESLLLNQAFTNRAFMLFREGDFTGTYLDAELALKYADSIRYPADFQETLKIISLIAITEGNQNVFQEHFGRLEHFIHQSGEDYINLERVKGLYLCNNAAYDEAIKHLEAAIQYELNSGFDHVAVYSNLCYLLSECYKHKGQYAKALDAMMLNAGLGEKYDNDIFKNYVLNSPLYPFISTVRCADLYYTSYKHSGNTGDLLRCYDLLTLVDSLIFRQFKVSEENAILLFYLESGAEFFRLGVESSYALWLKTSRDDYTEDFFQYCEKSKNSLMFRDYMLSQQYSRIPDSILVLERKLKSDLSAEQMRGLRDNRIFNQLIASYFRLENLFEKFYPDFFNNPLMTTVQDLRSMKNIIPDDDTAVLHIKESDGHWYLGLLTKDDSYISKVQYRNGLISDMDSLLAICRDDLLVSPDAYQQLAYRIYNGLFEKPIRDRLKKNLIIIPDGYFYRFPLSAVVEQIHSSADQMDSLFFLYKNRQINYAPSIQMLTEVKTRNDQTAKRKVAVFAFSDRETIRSEHRTSLSELPGTYREAMNLKKKYPDASVFTGTEATKENFLKVYKDTNYAYIHLALHGVANSKVKDDVKLYFRTSNGGLDSLYGYELLKNNSKIRKVVLSACQSGLGKYQKGEGNFSLPRYFMINGASDVTASLWDLSDNFNPDKPNPAIVRYVK